MPYRILAVEGTIMIGGHFYNMETVTESCIGILQTFISGPSQNTAAFSNALLIFGRMVIHLHQQLVIEGVPEDQGEMEVTRAS